MQSVVIEENVHGYLCASIATIYIEIEVTKRLLVPLGNSDQSNIIIPTNSNILKEYLTLLHCRSVKFLSRIPRHIKMGYVMPTE